MSSKPQQRSRLKPSALHSSVFSELIFAWVFNDYPNFVQQDNRRFVSQETGNLYIAKVEPSDVGNYTCVINNSITKDKVLSSPTPLVLRNDGKICRHTSRSLMVSFE